MSSEQAPGAGWTFVSSSEQAPGDLNVYADWRVSTTKTPRAGWTVCAFEYTMNSSNAFIYLAVDEERSQHSIQFWWPTAEPTEYHGDWHLNGGGQLYINFNGQGLFEDDGTHRKCHGVNLMRTASGTFSGHDYRGRKVTLVHTSTWTVSTQGHFQEAPDSPDFS